jgi:hypothetical protein
MIKGAQRYDFEFYFIAEMLSDRAGLFLPELIGDVSKALTGSNETRGVLSSPKSPQNPIRETRSLWKRIGPLADCFHKLPMKRTPK